MLIFRPFPAIMFASLCVALSITAAAPVPAQEPETRHALLVGGLGGSPEYTQTYRAYLSRTRQAFIDRFRFPPGSITVLAEPALESELFVDAVSSADRIRAAFDSLAARATDHDDVYIILFGHGSFDGESAALNIPLADLKDADYAELAGNVRARRLVFINTASCSAPFISRLSAPGRIVAAATRTGTERVETVFPRFLVEAFETDTSDLDKNGELSVLEVFRYAAERTARQYEEDGRLATEHPIIEDTGDRKAFGFPDLAGSGEGALAATTLLRDAPLMASIGAAVDSTMASLLAEQAELTRAVTALIAEKAGHPEQEYYTRLERLFISLALTNNRIERHGGGSGGQ